MLRLCFLACSHMTKENEAIYHNRHAWCCGVQLTGLSCTAEGGCTMVEIAREEHAQAVAAEWNLAGDHF